MAGILTLFHYPDIVVLVIQQASPAILLLQNEWFQTILNFSLRQFL